MVTVLFILYMKLKTKSIINNLSLELCIFLKLWLPTLKTSFHLLLIAAFYKGPFAQKERRIVGLTPTCGRVSSCVINGRFKRTSGQLFRADKAQAREIPAGKYLCT